MCEPCVIMRYTCIFCFLYNLNAGNEKKRLLSISVKKSDCWFHNTMFPQGILFKLLIHDIKFEDYPD